MRKVPSTSRAISPPAPLVLTGMERTDHLGQPPRDRRMAYRWANAWSSDVTWGSSTTRDGQPIEFGLRCATPTCDDGATAWTIDPGFRNVVWGSKCGNSNCDGPWMIDVFTATVGDTVVWGDSRGRHGRLGHNRGRHRRVGHDRG